MKRRMMLLCLLLTTMVWGSALGEKKITITFTGDVTLGNETYLMKAEDAFCAFYNRNGP